MSTGSLSADTWTKVIKTIPGNSNLTINNDIGVGANFYLMAFSGTTYTNDPDTLHNAWQVYNSNTEKRIILKSEESNKDIETDINTAEELVKIAV